MLYMAFLQESLQLIMTVFGSVIDFYDFISPISPYSYSLRWLKTVSSTFQDVDFDGLLLPLFIN